MKLISNLMVELYPHFTFQPYNCTLIQKQRNNFFYRHYFTFGWARVLNLPYLCVWVIKKEHLSKIPDVYQTN